MTTRRNRKRARLEEVQPGKDEAPAAAVTVAVAVGAVTNTKAATAAATATTKKAIAKVAAEKANEDWETSTEIKLEDDDGDDQEMCRLNDVNDDDDDIKPDVFDLQQEISRQQHSKQQQQLRQLPPVQPHATTTAPAANVASSTALLPSTTALFIISDLDGNGGLTLMPISNSVVLKSGSIVDGAAASTIVVGRAAKSLSNVSAVAAASAAVDDAVGRNCLQMLFAGNSAPSTASMPTSSTAPVATAATVSKFSNYVLDAGEVDMQESDTDEEGYSDIDLDEDDELIEDDDDLDVYDPEWTDQPTAPRKVFRFDTPVTEIGLEGRPKSTNPVFYFDEMLGDRGVFFTQLANGSNERAERLLNTNAGQTYLEATTAHEMQVFFGVCLQMSSLRLSSLGEYWDEKAHYGFSGFRNKLSLSRFQMLLQMISFKGFNDKDMAISNIDASLGDVFVELNPLLNFFNRRMENIYNCGQRLVLNEPMMYWKGKLDWAKNMREKFRCNAVMLHFLTEQTGLLLKIIPDIHRKERRQHVRNSRLLVCERISIAKELMKEKLGRGHTVHVSKYYGSYGLCYEMTNHQTYSTGLLECKRYGNSKQLILTNLSSDLFATKYAASIMMGKCRRREKSVYFFSSDCIAIYAKEMTSKSIDPRPKIIKELDWQLRTPSNIREYMLDYQIGLQRKDIKWDKRVLIYIFNLIVLNAFILYTMHAQFGRARIFELHLKDTSKLKSYEEFRQDIVASLLNLNESKVMPDGSVNSVKATGRVSKYCKEQYTVKISTTDTESDEGRDHIQPSKRTHKNLVEVEHMPMVIPKRNGKAMKKKCRICRKGGMLTFSKLCCERCPGMPGLCESPCFRIWHDQLQKTLNAGERIKIRTFGTSGEQTIHS